MNRDFIFITTLIKFDKNEINYMPSWARDERLYNCEVPSTRRIQRNVKQSIANSLRELANRMDPLELPSKQTQL